MSAAGELLIVGLSGPELLGSEARLLRRIQPGGVILFARNLTTLEALRELIDDIRGQAPETLMYLDAEGGRVDRLRTLVAPAPAAGRLAAAAPSLAGAAGRWVGRALRGCGFDADFAPVVDLDRGQRDNALDGRTFGTDAATVVPRARAFLDGLHAAGIGGCVKHFPGLGGAQRDTHREGAPIELDREQLERDLAPFRALAARAAAVMISHAGYPSLDRSARPATLSAAIATDLLRGDLRFRGIAVSDDLEMYALAPWGGLVERTVAALRAGCDLLPICHDLEGAAEASRRLGARSLAARREQALARARRWRRHLAELKKHRRVYRLEVIRRELAALENILNAA